MKLSLNPKTFSDSFLPFLDSSSNFKHFEKKMIVIATLFRKLQTLKDLVRPLSKNQPFRAPFYSENVKGSQTLVKSSWEHFHHIFPSLRENRIWKISALVICQILEVFRKTLPGNDKYAVWGCENLCSPIKMKLSLNPKNFSDSFVRFLDSSSNFKDFVKKHDRESYFISEITDCQRLG